MSTTIVEVNKQIRLCPFINEYNTISHYACYRTEKCCRQGCCLTYSYKYFQSWYFWLMVILMFGIFYAISWYCKKMEVSRKRRNECMRRTIRTHTNIHTAVDTTPRTIRNSDEPLIDYLLLTYGNRQHQQGNANSRESNMLAEPPPKYQDAIHMPKRDPSLQVAQVHATNEASSTDIIENSNNECPPTYEDATHHRDNTIRDD